MIHLCVSRREVVRMVAMLLQHRFHQYPQRGYRQRTASGTKPE